MIQTTINWHTDGLPDETILRVRRLGKVIEARYPKWCLIMTSVDNLLHTGTYDRDVGKYSGWSVDTISDREKGLSKVIAWCTFEEIANEFHKGEEVSATKD